MAYAFDQTNKTLKTELTSQLKLTSGAEMSPKGLLEKVLQRGEASRDILDFSIYLLHLNLRNESLEFANAAVLKDAKNPSGYYYRGYITKCCNF